MCVKRGNMKGAYLLMDVTNVNFINDNDESVLKHAIQSRDIEMTNHILNFIKQHKQHLSNFNKVWFFFCLAVNLRVNSNYRHLVFFVCVLCF